MQMGVKIWWILFQLIIIYPWSVLLISLCYPYDEYYNICKMDNDRLIDFYPKDYTIMKNLNEVRLSDKNISVIENFAFSDDLSSITTLILNLTDDQLLIESHAFTNLSRLENLEINSGPVLLELNSFKGLKTLKFLKLQINEVAVHISTVLKNIPNLQALELVDYDTIKICDYSYSENITLLSELIFTGGFINKLPARCFACLGNLRYLAIRRSSLSRLESGSFNGLVKLKTLSLVNNFGLRRLPFGVFNVPNYILDVIELSNNAIRSIDKEAFALVNLFLLDLSNNELENIERRTFTKFHCKQLDLSRNNIRFIENDAFYDSIIHKIFMFDNLILQLDSSAWGLDKTVTSVFTDILLYETTAGAKVFVKSLFIEIQGYLCSFSKHHFFKICKKPNSTVVSVTALVPDKWLPKTLELSDDEMSFIAENSFDNLNITTLIITSASRNFTISSKSFLGLPELETLKINTQFSLLNTDYFQHLKSLRSLQVSVKETKLLLCDALPNLPNLTSLIIVNDSSINICNHFCKYRNVAITYLQYVNGTFTTLKSLSFICLKNLEHLVISKSALQSFEDGAFNGLEKLKTLVLQHNNNLTHIADGIFGFLENLHSLVLSDNSIKTIGSEVFTKFNEPISLLDLSNNKLINIKVGTFSKMTVKTLDLSNNQLNHIENGAFKDAHVEKLYIFGNPGILVDSYAWNLDESTIESNCYYNENNRLIRICKKYNTITFVESRDLEWADIFQLFEGKVSLHSLEISDDTISCIQKYSFNRLLIKNLIIRRSFTVGFVLYPQSLEGLLVLESLELNVGPILLQAHLFKSLKSTLKTLKIQVAESIVYLSQVLADLTKLKTLEIFRNHSVGICQNPYAMDIPPIRSISYKGGSISILQAKSLTCLPHLEYFTITESNLKTLEPGAFNGLNKLKSINLIANKISHIVKDVFDKLHTLTVLKLNHNMIDKIDDQALTKVGDNLQVLNMSYNQLSVIGKDTFSNIGCNHLDLSQNKIESIKNGAFRNSNIGSLFLFNNTNVIADAKEWGISAPIFIAESFYRVRIRNMCFTEKPGYCETCRYTVLCMIWAPRSS